MGLSDDYILPNGYSDAYHLAGDGVVVRVVRHLARHLLEPDGAGHGRIGGPPRLGQRARRGSGGPAH